MKKTEPKEKDAALTAKLQAEERSVMRQRRIRNRRLLETEEPVVLRFSAGPVPGNWPMPTC